MRPLRAFRWAALFATLVCMSAPVSGQEARPAGQQVDHGEKLPLLGKERKRTARALGRARRAGDEVEVGRLAARLRELDEIHDRMAASPDTKEHVFAPFVGLEVPLLLSFRIQAGVWSRSNQALGFRERQSIFTTMVEHPWGHVGLGITPEKKGLYFALSPVPYFEVETHHPIFGNSIGMEASGLGGLKVSSTGAVVASPVAPLPFVPLIHLPFLPVPGFIAVGGEFSGRPRRLVGPSRRLAAFGFRMRDRMRSLVSRARPSRWLGHATGR